MHKLYLSVLSAMAIASWSSPASAQEPAGAVSRPPAGASGAARSATSGDTADCLCFLRHRPTRNQLELGIFTGVILPADDSHELYDPLKRWAPYKSVAPGLGARFGYYPLALLGLEIEGVVGTTKIDDSDGGRVLLSGFRGYGLFQLPYRIAPFALLGIGFLGARSDRLGKDIDPAIHLGGGVKFYVNRRLAVRVDIRDTLGAKHRVDAGNANHAEVLLGLSVLLNRKERASRPRAAVKDSDGDGFLDAVDRCSTTRGVGPHVCPPPPPPKDPDSDGDGLADPVDACPKDPGSEPDGCPDGDGDGYKDGVDKCPKEPGAPPDGCPAPDTDADADGILDSLDTCRAEPETRNGYKDVDGCPDEVPQAVQAFTGVIDGIYFDVNSGAIETASRPALERAVKLLRDFPEVRVEISGHTDSDGSRDHNVELSRQRAEAVKQYLVDSGIDGSRLTTRGHGPDRPIADNTTRKGKSDNRRIEFRLNGE